MGRKADRDVGEKCLKEKGRKFILKLSQVSKQVFQPYDVSGSEF